MILEKWTHNSVTCLIGMVSGIATWS